MFQSLRKFADLSLIPVVVWLFVQLAMTGVFSPANASTTDTLFETKFSNTIIICTDSGLKRITLNADGSLPQDAPDEENYCPWCMHFGKLPPLNTPTAWQMVPSALACDIIWVSNSDRCTGQNDSVHFHSRAPPLNSNI